MARGEKPRSSASAIIPLVVLACAAHASGQPPTPLSPSEPFRVDVHVVNVYCTVKDKNGGLVTDLELGDFELREDGKPQSLRYFAREIDRPLTLALLMDTSDSQRSLLPMEKETAALFLERVLRPGDLAAVITFDVHVDLLQDFTDEVGRLHRAVERARIHAPSPLGPFPGTRAAGTRLWDAIYLVSAEKLAPEVGRKAIVVLSDGADTGSETKLEEALEAAQRSDVMIYAILIQDPDYYYDRGYGSPDAGKLERLARETGGRTLGVNRPDHGKLAAAFDAIAAELRSQYSLGYTSTNRAADGQYRRIELKVRRKGLRVQARRGYYAPRAPATPAR